MKEMMLNLEIAINKICDFAKDKTNTSKDALEAFDYFDIIEECKWLTYHKCEIRKILDRRPF